MSHREEEATERRQMECLHCKKLFSCLFHQDSRNYYCPHCNTVHRGRLTVEWILLRQGAD